ncbi:glycosyltransferase [Clostridium sp. SM-530-WT-3G]|nr:glycosyltransferase [Clostridium sp. SM-530-WT-3G]NME83081.1 glycosyltransferase [Clostridium sp. SM-530-WT-3G]
MAVYDPNYEWLKEQLISLNNQTYSNLELIIYDDCPENKVDEEFIKKYITNMELTIIHGERNLGSNKAFEKLTQVGKGEYYSYCDQDDIWESGKISRIMEKFDDSNVTLAFCDLSIIDKDGKKTSDSLRNIRRRIVYRRGYNLEKELLMTNFVTGCAMIVKKEVAQRAMPFISEMVHDQWIAIIAAKEGKIEFIDDALVQYRQHDSNQTGILKGIYDKKSYYEKRIDKFLDRYEILKNRLDEDTFIKNIINETIIWLRARDEYSKKHTISSLFTMIKYRKFHKESILIEIFLPIIPEYIFKMIIRLTKKGLL